MERKDALILQDRRGFRKTEQSVEEAQHDQLHKLADQLRL